MTSRAKVVITHRVHQPVKELLSVECEVVANDDVETWPRSKLLDASRDAAGLLVFMPDLIDDALLAASPNLRVIAAALKGFDNIDVAACTRRGIWVAIVPDLLTSPTAELALTLTLGLTRNVLSGDHRVRSGEFKGWRPLLYGDGLVGKTVGVVGMGKLGQAFVKMLAGFNVRVLYYDPVPLSPVQDAFLGVARRTLDQLLAQSDVTVCLAPLTSVSQHKVNEAALRQMRPGSYLVNVGRGSVVDEQAVALALQDGRLAGYAADVFEMEDWARPDRPARVAPGLLAQAEKTLFTPHLGSAVKAVRLEIELAAARSILQALRGERPQGAINEVS